MQPAQMLVQRRTMCATCRQLCARKSLETMSTSGPRKTSLRLSARMLNPRRICSNSFAAALMPVKAMLGFYIGGMGAKKRNFHMELMSRMGFEAEAHKIQDLFFAGKRAEAIATVPDQFADEISLCGPRERIRERLAEWRAAGVTTLMVAGDAGAVRTLAELAP